MVTLGNFDGLHSGHRRLLSRLILRAGKNGAESVVLSFFPHTQSILRPKLLSRVMNTLEEKKILLGALGIDRLVLLRFTPEIARCAPAEFFDRWIRRYLRPAELVVGPNHHFGRGGSPSQLRRICRNAGVGLRVVPLHRRGARSISSTKLRLLLERGDMEAIRRLSGMPFLCMGRVIHGQGAGRKLGFPTANLDVDWKAKLLPPQGVYGGLAAWDGARRRCLIHIGPAPTLGRRSKSFEVFVPGFLGNLYGRRLMVWIFLKLRELRTFPDGESLRNQIKKDINKMQKLNLPRRISL